MNRRSILTTAGITFGSATAGCLESSESDRRDAACSHMPATGDQLQYETAILRHDYVPLVVGGEFVDGAKTEETTPFVLVSTEADIETRLRLDALDETDADHATVRSFIAETDFETETLLVWQTSTASTGYQIEIVGVTRPASRSVHAYTCRYHNGGANGTVMTPYNIAIRVAVPRQPNRAELTVRSGGAAGTDHDTATFVDYRDRDENGGRLHRSGESRTDQVENETP